MYGTDNSDIIHRGMPTKLDVAETDSGYEEDRGLLTPANNTYKCRLWLVVIILGLSSGSGTYAMSVLNNVDTTLEEWINSTLRSTHDLLHLKTAELSMFWTFSNAALFLGAAIASPFLPTISNGRRLGRRGAMFIVCALNIIGPGAIVIARFIPSYELFFIGRFLIGVAVGLARIATVFAVEIAPIQYRGAAPTLVQVMHALITFAALAITLPGALGSSTFWPLAVAIGAVPSMVQLVFLFFIPESPKFLHFSKRSAAEVRKALVFYQGPMTTNATMSELDAEHEADSTSMVGYVELFWERKWRKPLALCLTIAIAGLGLSGNHLITMYSTNIFMAAGASQPFAQNMSVVMGFVHFIGIVPVVFLVERFGRRLFLKVMLFGCAISLIGFSICAGVNARGAFFGEIAFIILNQLCYVFGNGIAGFVINELFQTTARSTANGVTGTVAWLVNAFIVFGYPPFRDAVGVSLSFLPNIIGLVLGGVIVWAFLPETRGVWIANIERQLGSRGYTKL